LAAKKLPLEAIDHGVLGLTVPQDKSFWGVPWMMSLIGAQSVSGPTVSQACATSARCLSVSAAEIAGGDATVSLVVTGDRTSNGPVLLHPNPKAPSGAPGVENWVLDNFREDPNARCAINGAFQRRYMPLPLSIPDQNFRKETGTLTTDEGIHATTAEGLAKLKPVVQGGTVTYGGQTHPADGNAGMILTNAERAAELSSDRKIAITLRGFGQARERAAYMPAAPVKAARRALEQAGLGIDGIDAIKSHNPFIVNDIVFARETGVDPRKMNNYGCSLVFGHPQGPTGLRLIIELIEELVMKGGGLGLFHGCAAGDTAMAVVGEVRGAR